MSHVATYNTWVKFMEADAKLLIDAMKDLGHIEAANDLKNIKLTPTIGRVINFVLTEGSYVPKTDTYGYEEQMKATMSKIQQRYKAAILTDILRQKGFSASFSGTMITAKRY